MDNTSERLRALRDEQLQTTVAQETGISRSSLSQYENGMRPPLDALISLANYYHVSLDYLAGLSNEKKSVGGQLGNAFSELAKVAGDVAPTATEINDLLEAAVRYYAKGAPCGDIPMRVLHGFVEGLRHTLNAAIDGDIPALIDKANAATVAALEVTKMPAVFLEGKATEVQK